MKIKNLLNIEGMDEHYEGVSLDDCLQKMAVDWYSVDYCTGLIPSEIYEYLKEEEGITWQKQD